MLYPSGALPGDPGAAAGGGGGTSYTNTQEEVVGVSLGREKGTEQEPGKKFTLK